MGAGFLFYAIAFWFILLSHFTYSQTLIKSAKLLPNKPFDNGARVMQSTFDVQNMETTNGLYFWHMSVSSQRGWSFILSLDNSFGFDPDGRTAISITMNVPQNTAIPDDLLFGVTANNQKYIGIAISEQELKIYPCVPRVAGHFGVGDIARIPRYNRYCDVAGGDCFAWKSQIYQNPQMNKFPLTITIENDPVSNLLSIYVTTATKTIQIAQSCGYTSFPTNHGLKMYISGSVPGNSFIVNSFDILYEHTTPEPTKFPTLSPTLKPTNFPSIDPTLAPTKYPTTSPTKRPTKNPTINPTKFPTISPTLKPTNFPSVNPTKNPTISPTKYPTQSPTTNPTGRTANPSVSPTESPLTKRPTPNPTPRPVPAGFQLGAHDNLCSFASSPKSKCLLNTMALSDNNSGQILCLYDYDCCMCASIECGLGLSPCKTIKFGDNGARGVKDIAVIGNMNIASSGTIIECQGEESCAETSIRARYVQMIYCGGFRACENAMIMVTEPKKNFLIRCIGIESCYGLRVVVNLPGPPQGFRCADGATSAIIPFGGIICANDHSCEYMDVTINNDGCDSVEMDKIECKSSANNACNGATFNFFGDIEIGMCECDSSCSSARGLSACDTALSKVQCSDPLSCYEQTRVVINPLPGFLFECNGVQSCERGNFRIELNKNAKHGPIRFLDSLIMGGWRSGSMATFDIDNGQEGVGVTIGRIECNGIESCEGTTFIIPASVFVRNFICVGNACSGCLIKESKDAKIGSPCARSFVPI